MTAAPLRTEPRPGSRIRRLYDRLRESEGGIIDVSDLVTQQDAGQVKNQLAAYGVEIESRSRVGRGNRGILWRVLSFEPRELEPREK